MINYDNNYFRCNPNSAKTGYFSDVSSPVKQAVSIPVILTGGITTAQQAEDLLSCGAADLIGGGRAIMKDSDWASKAIKSFM
jgi:NADPH2 dehydrogenase